MLKGKLNLLLAAFLLLFFVSLTEAKTVTVTSYITKYKYTQTQTYTPNPSIVVVYNSKTVNTFTSTILKSSTTLPPPLAVSSVYSFVYKHATVTTTSTSLIDVTSSISSTYTVS